MIDYPNLEVKNIIKNIKAAKETENTVQGLISKRLNCLVFRGNNVDREILISGKMLKLWDMIRPSFPHETISTYISKLRSVDQNKISSIYEKSKIPTKEKLSRTDRKCTKLRQHI